MPIKTLTIAYAIVGSFATNLQYTNICMAPVSSIIGTANPLVWMDKYNRPHCDCTLLSYELSTFPAYLLSASYVNLPVLSQSSCQYY